MKVITLVSGNVPQNRRKDFESGYHSVRTGAIPQGLETSFLLRKADGSGLYIIETIWSSQEALEEMRSKQKPKAMALFEDVGISPTVEVYEVADTVP